MQAMNTLCELNLSFPCRNLIGSSSRPLAGEAVAAMRKTTGQVSLDKMKTRTV